MSELQHARIAELCGELRLGAVPGPVSICTSTLDRMIEAELADR